MPRGFPFPGSGGGGGGGTPVLPTFVGFIAGANASNVTLTGSSISAGSIQPGDLLLCCATHQNAQPAFPAGWTPIQVQQIIQFNGVACHCSWFQRVATGMEPASYVFGGNLSNACLVDFRGAGAITSVPVINDPGTASANPQIPAVTTRYANQIVLAAFANVPAAGIAPTGYTTISNAGTIGGTAFGLWVGYKTVPSAGTLASVTVPITSNTFGTMAFAIGQ